MSSSETHPGASRTASTVASIPALHACIIIQPQCLSALNPASQTDHHHLPPHHQLQGMPCPTQCPERQPAQLPHIPPPRRPTIIDNLPLPHPLIIPLIVIPPRPLLVMVPRMPSIPVLHVLSFPIHLHVPATPSTYTRAQLGELKNLILFRQPKKKHQISCNCSAFLFVCVPGQKTGQQDLVDATYIC